MCLQAHNIIRNLYKNSDIFLNVIYFAVNNFYTFSHFNDLFHVEWNILLALYISISALNLV